MNDHQIPPPRSPVGLIPLGKPAAQPFEIVRIRDGIRAVESDQVATEEPLELRLEGSSIAVIMRTPGADRELAAGFLVSEGLVRSSADIAELTPLRDRPTAATCNVINVTLTDPSGVDLGKLSRHVFTSSSCGICSKTTIDAVRSNYPPIPSARGALMSTGTLLGLPAKLIAAQEAFRQTGGLHACAVFDSQGSLLALREDVGRHNALDKILGWALLKERLPLHDAVLVLSGRVSFEMIQKALAAGIPLIGAIGAPSSLAIEFARASNQTLAGFLRPTSLNIYTHPERIT